MSDYFDYEVFRLSKPELEQGHLDDFSPSGIQHSRKFHARQYYRFPLLHVLTLEEFEDLLEFYEAEPREEHTLVFHGVAYTVKFLQPPQIVLNREDGKYNVEVQMRGYIAESF